jgi:transposase
MHKRRALLQRIKNTASRNSGEKSGVENSLPIVSGGCKYFVNAPALGSLDGSPDLVYNEKEKYKEYMQKLSEPQGLIKSGKRSHLRKALIQSHIKSNSISISPN